VPQCPIAGDANDWACAKSDESVGLNGFPPDFLSEVYAADGITVR